MGISSFFEKLENKKNVYIAKAKLLYYIIRDLHKTLPEKYRKLIEEYNQYLEEQEEYVEVNEISIDYLGYGEQFLWKEETYRTILHGINVKEIGSTTTQKVT